MNKIKRCLGAHGEIRIYEVEEGFFPLDLEVSATEPDEISGSYILSHSEKGNHHVVSSADCEVLERTETKTVSGNSFALKTLYAIVKSPTKIKQLSTEPHEDFDLPVGHYVIRADVNYDHFSKQVEKVRD